MHKHHTERNGNGLTREPPFFVLPLSQWRGPFRQDIHQSPSPLPSFSSHRSLPLFRRKEIKQKEKEVEKEGKWGRKPRREKGRWPPGNRDKVGGGSLPVPFLPFYVGYIAMKGGREGAWGERGESALLDHLLLSLLSTFYGDKYT